MSFTDPPLSANENIEIVAEIKKHFTHQLSDSHKGQNGKVLIIGGSSLFHAASKWSLDIASKLVDMVFYASVQENNELIQQVKGDFWNGIVIPRADIEAYIEEADCILIGPGMSRNVVDKIGDPPAAADWCAQNLTSEDWEHHTQKITNYLLAKYPQKKWVVDAGALQMCDPRLLSERVVITPHAGELRTLLDNLRYEGSSHEDSEADSLVHQLRTYEELHAYDVNKITFLLKNGVTILFKGKRDLVLCRDRIAAITGGNSGLTKGGTGDVLAGLVAGLNTVQDVWVATITASLVNKRAGERLFQTVGPYYNASDLVEEIPQALWEVLD